MTDGRALVYVAGTVGEPMRLIESRAASKDAGAASQGVFGKCAGGGAVGADL